MLTVAAPTNLSGTQHVTSAGRAEPTEENDRDRRDMRLAEALFTSHLSASSQPSRAEEVTAVEAALRVYGGVQGCAVQMAGEYGEHPESAARRMRWALHVAKTASPPVEADAQVTG
jgi:hypothetical protein